MIASGEYRFVSHSAEGVSRCARAALPAASGSTAAMSAFNSSRMKSMVGESSSCHRATSGSSRFQCWWCLTAVPKCRTGFTIPFAVNSRVISRMTVREQPRCSPSSDSCGSLPSMLYVPATMFRPTKSQASRTALFGRERRGSIVITGSHSIGG